MKVEFKGDQLVITIPASKADLDNAVISKGGKMRLLATSHGFMTVLHPTLGTPVRISMNVGC